jgi:hypothetical protein
MASARGIAAKLVVSRHASMMSPPQGKPGGGYGQNARRIFHFILATQG